MDTVTKMNGRTLSEFKNSYVLACLVEETFSKYGELTDEEKKNLCEKIDKLFSELFKIPRGVFVFEEKEYTTNPKKIYIGKLDDIRTGAELMFRYLFQKRQQFQRLCVVSKKALDFGDEFPLLEDSYAVKPISKEPQYTPMSKGFSNYLTNYSKIDALSFAFEGIGCMVSLTDSHRVASGMALGDGLSLAWSMHKIKRYQEKISREVEKGLTDMDKISEKFEKYMKAVADNQEEYLFLKYLEDVLEGMDDSIDQKQVLLCFNENVWSNLNENQRKQAVQLCNELISNVLKCNVIKNVEFEYGRNSYDFSESENVYVGDINKEKPSTILQRLVYEYSFCI